MDKKDKAENEKKIKTQTKSLKLKIKMNDDIDKLLKDLRYNSSKILNYTIQRLYWWHNFSLENVTIGADGKSTFPLAKDIYGCSFRNQIYRECVKKFPMLMSGNLSQTVCMGESRWRASVKDIMKMACSIPSYKLNSPVFVATQSFKVKCCDGAFMIDVGLVSMKYAKETETETRYNICLDLGDKQIETLNSIIKGGSKQCFGQFLYNDTKREWFFFMSYSQEVSVERVGDTVMGIDMSPSNPLYIALNTSGHKYSVSGSAIKEFKERIQNKRKAISGGIVGQGKIGHGRKKRLESAQSISRSINNFTNNMLHKYSSFVLKLALKHKVGLVQMEDLTGLGKTSPKLSDWAYYNLQMKIKYKLAQEGINVKMISPSYTSMRCSDCGHIDKGNIDKEKTFKCLVCGYTADLGYNAARNISNPNVELLIEEFFKEHE